MGAKGMVFQAWVHEHTPFNLHWLVLRIGGADFLHCLVTDSIWLERAESLIAKYWLKSQRIHQHLASFPSSFPCQFLYIRLGATL